MKVQRRRPQPLHEPLAGGTPGADGRRSSRWSPATSTGPLPLMESPGAAAFVTLRAAAGAAQPARPRVTVPVPAFLIRHPSAGAILVDTGLHPSIATDPQRELRPPRPPLRQADAGGRRRRPRAAAQARARPGRDPDRRDDPPAHRPHLGDLRVPELDLRRQRDRVGGGRDRAPARCFDGYRRAHYDYAFDYRTVDFDRGAIDSYAHLRPHLRPLRRRLDPPRLHPGPQRRPHVGDRPPAASATS